jgi:hypothetical protein
MTMERDDDNGNGKTQDKEKHVTVLVFETVFELLKLDAQMRHNGNRF